MPGKLLCATDGSKQAEKAIGFAVDLAKKLGASLTFLNVNTVPEERAARTYFWDQSILDAADAQAHMALGMALKAARKGGLPTSECIEVNGRNIAKAIVSFAKKGGFDQIVMGSAGRRGAARLLLGSVAADVAATASCPVTIVS